MINTTHLRATIGKLGMLLPWIVLILSYAIGIGFPDSISATYYISSCITPFMIILGSAGLFLFSYKGYDRQDDIICSLAGAFALGICLFPCGTTNLIEHGWTFLSNMTQVGTFQIMPTVSGILHNICAISFFALLAYNSLCLFTKTSGQMTDKKKKRNLIFKICGIGMIASFVLLVPMNIFNVWGGTWIVETIALAFFGISWLTKANCYPWLFAESVSKN